MKYLFTLFLFSSSLNAQFLYQQDKQLHMGGTYVISSIASSYTLNKTNDKRKALLVGIVAGITAGLAKEIYDIKYGNPDLADLAADAIGATTGALVITIPLERKRRP